MSIIYAYLNGQFISENEASLSISDLAIQRGYGIFDFLKILNGNPVFLDDHLDRFYGSAADMFLKPPVKKAQLKKVIAELIKLNQMPNAGIKITLTGGDSPDGYGIGNPNLIIQQSPFLYNTQIFEDGISLVTYEHQRQLPHIKTIDYLFAIYLQHYLKDYGADEVLYHYQNEITECPRANFFIVTRNNEVITPAKNILSGITRKKILQIFPLNIREGTITLKDVANAKEAFITSTTKNVLPVLSINGQQVGEGKPGEITRQISSILQKLLNG